ncbi:MAG: hypothetical protein VXZ96_08825 [Myxococcota bacterium]|nr:hypothetical protein [Myxococcota bacterium]
MYSKKMWTLSGAFADHRQVFLQLPRILLAYVGPNSIEPSLNEAVMVTVNSVNSCPFCEGLHGELARMAGVDGVDSLMKADSLETCQKLSPQPAITYARIFAENNGRGQLEIDAFEELSSSEGSKRAASIRALCWFLQWGSIGGNTINGFLARFKGQGRSDSNLIFEFLFVIYYGPLFLLIAAVNFLLKFFPKVPAWFSAAFGVILTFIAGTWIVPAGILSVLIPAKPKVLSRNPATA